MKTMLRSTLAALAAVTVLHAAPALAQAATVEATPPAAPAATPLAAPAAETVESRLAALEKKAGELPPPSFPVVKLGAVVQADARRYLDSSDNRLADVYLIRRARLDTTAALTPSLSARIQVDVAGGVLQFLDGYADARWIPGVTLRVGKFTPPVGYERLVATPSLLFIEYAQTSNLVPNRDVGLQASGDATRYLSWAIGIFDGAADGFNNDADASDGKDLVARLAVKPIDGLTIHLAGSSGNLAGTAAAPLLPSYRSDAQAVSYFRYNATAAAVGRHTRATAAASYYLGSLGLLGEYVASRQRVVNTTTAAPAVVTVATPTNAAWQAAASWVLTGEKNTEGILRPNRSLEQGGPGAIRVRARYQELDVDDVLFAGNVFANASTSSRKASGFNAGLDWWPVTPFRFSLEYCADQLQGRGDGRRRQALGEGDPDQVPGGILTARPFGPARCRTGARCIPAADRANRGVTGRAGQGPFLPGRRCSPHSFFSEPRQRPARGSSPGRTGEVQGAQPMREVAPRVERVHRHLAGRAAPPRPRRSVQAARGFTFSRPKRASHSMTRALGALRRLVAADAGHPAAVARRARRAAAPPCAASQQASGSVSQGGGAAGVGRRQRAPLGADGDRGSGPPAPARARRSRGTGSRCRA